MLPQEIKDKIQADCSVPYDFTTMLRGAEIAFTHQQKAFHTYSKLQDEYVREQEAKYQRAMVKLEQLHAARYMAMNLPKSEVADRFNEYKKAHNL